MPKQKPLAMAQMLPHKSGWRPVGIPTSFTSHNTEVGRRVVVGNYAVWCWVCREFGPQMFLTPSSENMGTTLTIDFGHATLLCSVAQVGNLARRIAEACQWYIAERAKKEAKR